MRFEDFEHKLKGSLGTLVISLLIIIFAAGSLITQYSGIGAGFEFFFLIILFLEIILLLFSLHKGWQKLLWLFMFLSIIILTRDELLDYFAEWLLLLDWLVYALIISIAVLFLAISSRRRREARKFGNPDLKGRGPV